MTASLPTRTLGADGPSVTRMGLGMASLGRPAYHNIGHAKDVDERSSVSGLHQHAHDVLDAAWQAGIRTFDVARSYGYGEAYLRSWLHKRRHLRDDVFVGSKWGYTYVGDWKVDAPVHEVKNHTVETFQRQQSESIELLGPWLQSYSIHSATVDSGVLKDSNVLSALVDWRDKHKIRIGLTVSGPNQADTIRKALAVREGTVFQVVQATYNLLDTSAGPALAEAHAAGVGVVIKEGVANGRLTSRSDLPDVLKVLNDVAQRLNTTPDAVALAAVLAEPWADVVLSGATTAEQVRSNVAACSLKLTKPARATLAKLAQDPVAYWSSRSELPWT